MIHLLPLTSAGDAAAPDAEGLARLGGLCRALEAIEPGCAVERPDAWFASAWGRSSEAARRCFAARSERAVASIAAALEALVDAPSAGRDANPAAVRRVADAIRLELEQLRALLAG